MLKEAMISNDGRFRYWLTREWDTYKRSAILFIMLNPSTADATKDDPTIRKCVGFAKCLEYGRIDVVNLYAFRATDPKALKTAGYPIGDANDDYIRSKAETAGLIVAAWGNHAQPSRADKVTLDLCARKNIYCLGITKQGFPRHPLMVSYKQPLVMFEGADVYP